MWCERLFNGFVTSFVKPCFSKKSKVDLFSKDKISYYRGFVIFTDRLTVEETDFQFVGKTDRTQSGR